MLTVLTENGFDVMIYTHDHEPLHVHVKKAGAVLVVNLGAEGDEPSVRDNKGMKRNEARRAFELVKTNKAKLVESWNEHHG